MAINNINLATPQPAGTPFLANNGNPNTVYNTAASPFAQQPAASTVAQPLATPAANLATPFISAVPAAVPASQTPFYRNLSSISPFNFNLGDVWGSSGAGWGTPTPPSTPPATNPTTPPATRPSTAAPSTGVDRVDLGSGGGSTLPPAGWTTVVRDRDNNQWVMPDANSARNMLEGTLRSIAEGFGANGFDEGRFDWNQFIDALSEPFLQGNLYNENVGRWNGLNVLEAVINQVLPGVNLGAALTSMAERMFPNSRFAQWIREKVVQNNVDRAKDRTNYMDAPQSTGRDMIGGGADFGGLLPPPHAVGGGGGLKPRVLIGELRPA